jgi:hypothetical protein
LVEIRDKLVVQMQQRKEEAQAKPGQVNNQVSNNPMELPINHAVTNQPNDLDVMFEDLHQFYMEDHYQQSNGEHLMQHNFDQQ